MGIGGMKRKGGDGRGGIIIMVLILGEPAPQNIFLVASPLNSPNLIKNAKE
jgi:hypothetical protein